MPKRKLEKHQNWENAGRAAARKYADMALKSKMRYRAFFKHIKSLGIQGKYLDIGAGPGIQTAMAAEYDPNVEITALEPSDGMITVGEEYIKSKGLENRIKYIKADATEESALGSLGTFDLVYSVHSLHHWQDPKAVIANCMKHVADKGVVLIHDLMRVWWLYIIPKKNGFFNSIRASYVIREVKELLTGYPQNSYTIKRDFPPFMYSIVLRKGI
jgi:ubiquinone/menaquinone biosynthesis C-methylase UbiE